MSTPIRMKPVADAITDVARFIARYVVLTPEQVIACALWVLHTYVLDDADITPYLAVTSAEKESGKSVLLEVLGSVAHKPWFAVRPSEAVLFRKIEKECPTLLLDEVDTIWGPKARSEDEGLRALLNAGFRRRGSTVPRCVGPTLKLRDFRTFCPKALGGIGDLPDTVASRSIPIRMERKRREDVVARWRWRDVEPIADNVRESITEAMAGALGALGGSGEEYVCDLPDELSDRAQDAWESLLAIADLAGDDWPVMARKAAVKLMATRIEEPPIGTRLLGDLRECFNGHIRISTADLIDLLAGVEDAPWGDWYGKPITGRKLASLLRPYGVTPRKTGGWRGYEAFDFEGAWSRYTSSPQPPPNAQTPVEEDEEDGAS